MVLTEQQEEETAKRKEGKRRLEIYESAKAEVLKKGKELTIVAVSYMVHEAIKSAEELSKTGIDVEVINLRTVKPWDYETISKSVKKTGRLIIADSGWVEGGIGAEISAKITGSMFKSLKSPVLRVGLPNIPAPCSRTLEEAYYPKSSTIIEAVEFSLKRKEIKKIVKPSKRIPGLISF